MTGLFKDPPPVGHRHAATAHAAAKKAAKGRESRAAEVLDRLHAARYDGLTCFQIEEATGWTHQSTSGLLKPMEDEGLVRVQGFHRKNRRGNGCRVYCHPAYHDPAVNIDPKPTLGPPPSAIQFNDGYAAGIRAMESLLPCFGVPAEAIAAAVAKAREAIPS